MALSNITVASVVPRGGPPGVAVAVVGSGFGAVQGQVIFDPLTQAVPATVTAWDPQNIAFTVPVMTSPLSNQFITVQVIIDGGLDSVTFLFWSPDPSFAAAPSHPGLDYQRPALEAGDDQDVDDPETITAADINRLMGIALSALSQTNFGAVTGSRGGNAALASLLSILDAAGVITDNTTA